MKENVYNSSKSVKDKFNNLNNSRNNKKKGKNNNKFKSEE